MNHRIDIQILRGLAVLVVVLFHLGIESVGRGFLGVDAFFVISGFLMAVLFRDGGAKDFYLRRARRLLPAYFATIGATVIAAWCFVLPPEQGQTAVQAMYAAVFASNFGFWAQNSYFSKIDFNPLLHLWSLGVEIQFYLLVPLLLPWLRRARWRTILVMATSLLLCLALLHFSPKTAFFMMPFRVWEFLLGFVAAEWFCRKGMPADRERFGWLGAGLLVLAGLLVMLAPVQGDARSALFGHPGIFALLVAAATAGVLVTGLPKGVETSLVGKALERLGGWSYSIYLAHFPVIVIGLYQPFGGTILEPSGPGEAAFLVGAIAAASALLYGLVEKRSARLFDIRWVPVAAVVLAALPMILQPMSTSRFSPEEQLIFAAMQDREPFRCGRLFRLTHPGEGMCELTGIDRADAPTILLVGDSHADAVKSSFADVAVDMGVRVRFTDRNDPLESPDRVAMVLDAARQPEVVGVVLHFRRSEFLVGMIEPVIRELLAADIPVTWILPVPDYDKQVPAELYHWVVDGRSPVRQTLADYESLNREILQLAENLAAVGLTVETPATLMCQPECVLTQADGRPVYYDHGHLTISGARLLRPVFQRAITALGIP